MSEKSSLRLLQGSYALAEATAVLQQNLMADSVRSIAELLTHEHGAAIEKAVKLLGEGDTACKARVKSIVEKIAETYAEGKAGIVVWRSLEDIPYFIGRDGRPLQMMANWLVRIYRPEGDLYHVLSYLAPFAETDPPGPRSKEILAALEGFAKEAKKKAGIEFTIERM